MNITVKDIPKIYNKVLSKWIKQKRLTAANDPMYDGAA